MPPAQAHMVSVATQQAKLEALQEKLLPSLVGKTLIETIVDTMQRPDDEEEEKILRKLRSDFNVSDRFYRLVQVRCIRGVEEGGG